MSSSVKPTYYEEEKKYIPSSSSYSKQDYFSPTSQPTFGSHERVATSHNKVTGLGNIGNTCFM